MDGIALAEEETTFVNNQKKLSNKQKLENGIRVIQSNYPGVQVDKTYMNKNSIGVIPKKDETSRTCPISMRQHSSNSVYFIIELLTDDVYCKCFKPECEGRLQLHSGEKLIRTLVGNVSISEKKGSKRKWDDEKTLPSLNGIKISDFSHQPILLSSSDCFDIYDSFKFVFCPAKKTEKRPVFSGWTKSTLADNCAIDVHKNNVAVVTGEKSGIFVLDLDIKDGGLDWFQRFCSKHVFNYTNYTLCVLTPSGGIHMYFTFDTKIGSNRVRMKDEDGADIGLDIRSNDGCVIAPPSTYATGSYSFICLKPPQPCPDFILSLF